MPSLAKTRAVAAPRPAEPAVTRATGAESILSRFKYLESELTRRDQSPPGTRERDRPHHARSVLCDISTYRNDRVSGQVIALNSSFLPEMRANFCLKVNHVVPHIVAVKGQARTCTKSTLTAPAGEGG